MRFFDWQSQQVHNQMSKKAKDAFLESLLAEAHHIHNQADSLKNAKEKAKAECKPQQHPSYIDPASLPDLHQECRQSIKRLKQQCSVAEERLLATEQQELKVMQALETERAMAKKKAFELARMEGLYHSQVEKSLKAKDQIEKLTVNLRSTSSRLKNSLTAYHTMRSVQQSADSHEREAMTKLIRHYEQQLYPQEAIPGDELDVRKLVNLTEEQQADIEALLSKMVQREEQVISTMAAGEEALRQIREETVFEQDLCAKIEESLKASTSIDRDLYDRCWQLAHQNALLRLRNQELEREGMRGQVTESSIRKYEQEVQELLRMLRQNTAEEMDSSELLGETAMLRQRLQWQEEELRAQKLSETSQKDLIRSLQQEQEERDSRQQQLEQQLEASQERIKALEGLEQFRGQSRSEIHLPPPSQPSLALTLPTYLPATIPPLEPLFATSEILERRGRLRVELAKEVRKAIGGMDVRTRLLFRLDEYHLNFGPYLEGQPAVLLLMAIDSSRLVAAFACFSDTSSPLSHPPAFLGTYNGEQWEWRWQREQEFKKLRAVRFWEGSLIFGNNQLIVRSNSSEHEAVLNTNVFGATFFEKLNTRAFLDDPAFHYQQLEIHALEQS